MPITSPIEYQIVVLERANEAFRDYKILTAFELDGVDRVMRIRELEGQVVPFKGEGRPHPKYAFVHFLGAVGAARMLSGDVGSAEVVEAWRGMFVSGVMGGEEAPGSWYNKAVVRVLARYLEDDEILTAMLAPLVEVVEEVERREGFVSEPTWEDEHTGGELGAWIQAGVSHESLVAEYGAGTFGPP